MADSLHLPCATRLPSIYIRIHLFCILVPPIAISLLNPQRKQRRRKKNHHYSLPILSIQNALSFQSHPTKVSFLASKTNPNHKVRLQDHPMSRFPVLVFLVFLLTPSLNARRLLGSEKLASAEENSVQTAVPTENLVPPSPIDGGDRFVKRSPSLDAGLFLSALPKGTVPPSAPGKKGHAVVVEEKLFTMHPAKMDRILKSVPSPGVGH